MNPKAAPATEDAQQQQTPSATTENSQPTGGKSVVDRSKHKSVRR
jgi:hypothetical protein